MRTGFTVDLDRLAPPDWDGRRVVLTFFLQDAGSGAAARFTLDGAKGEPIR
jgi:hypothetical protein